MAQRGEVTLRKVAEFLSSVSVSVQSLGHCLCNLLPLTPRSVGHKVGSPLTVPCPWRGASEPGLSIYSLPSMSGAQ